MEVINVDLDRDAYPVYVGNNILGQLNIKLPQHFKSKQIAVITSRAIYKLHGHNLITILSRGGYEVKTIFVPDGEAAKALSQAQYIYTILLEARFERNALIMAFGGGVVGDLAGFIAATFLRGVKFVQVPTTLLAQVDSSIGGKVGINHQLGKNLIGAFKQPLFVFSDVAFLKTLPDAEIRCGLGEVVKYGFILNRSLFEYLEDNLEKALKKDEQTLLHLVNVSSREKARVVIEDEKEKNLRMILNFGHTFGHALEAEFKFGELKHGEAVILGMKCALAYQHNAGEMAPGEFKRGIELLDRIPIKLDKDVIDVDHLIERMTLDKKVKDGRIRLVLVDHIGSNKIEYAGDQQALRDAFQVLF